ncbi:MAG: hypothetical protein ACTSWY_00225 [Promethearchaeota archaeon]
MAITIGDWIIFATVLIVFLVFLFFDAFRRDEPYGNLAYVVAVIPVNYLWYKITEPANLANFRFFGVTSIWTILLGLWIVIMARDMILIKTKKKDFDDVILYLIIGIIIQLILAAVLPADNVIVNMRADYGSGEPGTFVGWFFYLPNLNQTELSLLSVNLFKTMVTVLVLSIIFPMVWDLRGEPVNMWILVIITLIFALPFGLVCFLWLPDYSWALLLMVSVLFFIILLLLTRGEQQK